MPRKKQEPEKKGDDEQFEQEPMGGDIKISKNTGEEELKRYWTLVQKMQEYARGIVMEYVDVSSEDFYSESKNTDGSGQYIDAHISARPSIDLSSTSADEDWFSLIYIHTFSVKDRLRWKDHEYDIPESLEHVQGYIVQIGVDEPRVLFIDSSNPNLAKEVHEVVVSAVQRIEAFDALVDDIVSGTFKSEMAIDSQRGERPLIRVLSGADYTPPAPPVNYGMSGSASGVHVRKLDEREFEYDTINFERYGKAKNSAYENAQRQEGLLGEELSFYSFRGMMTPRVAKKLRPERYIDEFVFSFPAGFFVDVRAVGRRTRDLLQSEYDVLAYQADIGLTDNKIRIRINSTNRSQVETLMRELFDIFYSPIQRGEQQSLRLEVALAVFLGKHQDERMLGDERVRLLRKVGM